MLNKFSTMFRSFLLVSTFASIASVAHADGRSLFLENCSACHQANAQGIAGVFPALAKSKFVSGQPDVLAKTVLNGRAGMPAFKNELSDNDLSQILTYLRNSNGNKAPAIAPTFVKSLRKGPPVKAGLQAH